MRPVHRIVPSAASPAAATRFGSRKRNGTAAPPMSPRAAREKGVIVVATSRPVPSRHLKTTGFPALYAACTAAGTSAVEFTGAPSTSRTAHPSGRPASRATLGPSLGHAWISPDGEYGTNTDAANSLRASP